MAEETEKGRIPNFEGLVTVTVDRVTWHKSCSTHDH